jgi:MSHA pilin protein MshC
MRQSGFSLIELVVVMSIVGVLAVVALPRFFDQNSFESRGFHDETLAALRYAQKAAIAQRRNVCATFTSSSVTLRIAAVEGSGIACTLDLPSPTGMTPFVVTARTGVSFSGTPTNFRFDSLGRASISTQVIQVVNVLNSITVEQDTGYVHQ